MRFSVILSLPVFISEKRSIISYKVITSKKFTKYSLDNFSFDARFSHVFYCLRDFILRNSLPEELIYGDVFCWHWNSSTKTKEQSLYFLLKNQ